MSKKTINENLITNSNQSQQEPILNEFQNRNLVKEVDKLLIERLPDYLGDELKWIRKEYGDNDISEFLCGEDYYSESPLLKKIGSVIEELYKG